MIYLIGGAPRTGKSILSRLIAKETSVPLVELDGICREVCSKLPAAEQSELFPCPSFSGNPAENLLDPKKRAELQLMEGVTLRPEVDKIIQEYRGKQSSVIIEGVYLLPSHTAYLIEQFGQQELRCVFIGSVDPVVILDGLTRNTAPDDWLKESTQAVREQVTSFIVAYSEIMRREANRHELPYFERTTNFEQDVEQIKTQFLRS